MSIGSPGTEADGGDLRQRLLISLIVVMIGVGSAVAGLSPDRQAWRNGPAQFLMTPDEVAQWKTIQTDAGADAFIALFWAKRDPTPATPENEFKELFDARVRFADLHYAYGKTPGSLTPRGKAIVLLGAPYSVRREEEAVGPDIATVPVASPPALNQSGSVSKPDAAVRTEVAAAPGATPRSTNTTVAPGDKPNQSILDDSIADHQVRSETWVYEHDRTLNFSPQKTVTLVFVDQESIGEYRLGRSPDTNPSAVYEAAVKAAVISPGMVTVSDPHYHIGAASILGSGVASVAAESLHTPALLGLIDRMRGASELPFKGVFLSWGQFVTGTGESFVPVQLYLTRLPTLPARPATFFGTVFDSNGAKVASYERPVKLDISGSAFVADTSLSLPPGKYSGLFGVAVDDNPLAMVRGELEVKALDKASPGVSRLILSDDIHPMSAPQQPTDPFSFGGAKVVVKGDRLFNSTDDLWFFVELRNPGLDQEGTPQVRIQIDVEGMSGNQPVKLSFPLQDIRVEPLKGVAGHYALGQSIPLAKIPPGDYTMKLRVVDVVRQSTYDLDDRFSVMPAPSFQF